MKTVTAEELQAQFDQVLADARLPYSEFMAIGRDCAKKCGCSLNDLPDGYRLSWWFKLARDGWVAPPWKIGKHESFRDLQRRRYWDGIPAHHPKARV